MTTAPSDGRRLGALGAPGTPGTPAPPAPSMARAKDIFLEALDIDCPEQRDRFVAEQAGASAELRRLVCELLAADAEPDGPIAAGAGGGSAPRSAPAVPSGPRAGEPAPTRLGDRLVTRTIGAGGMGQVFAARGPDGIEVAVKLLHADAGPESIARFRREVSVLRRLDHPAIAPVLDWGVHDDGLGGRPWYAMELIAGGRPIDAWANERPRDPASIATMMADVADAVAHAHERGVIHRDLKASNLLVGGDDRPRVIDFGIARLHEREDATSDSDRFDTRSDQLLGTLTTIPPEQFDRHVGFVPRGPGAQGDDEIPGASPRRAEPPPADVRGDVYALGIVLYELLTGRLPWPLDDVPVFEIPRLVRETPPVRPSAIRPELRGDLDSILLTAIERDPERRYASPSVLAADLRHWLAGEAIAARRDHALQAMRRRVRQHRLTLGLLSVVAIAVSTASILLAQRLAELDRRNAALERQETFASLHHAGDAIRAGETTEARRLLDRARPLSGTWMWRHFDRRTREAMAVPSLHLGGGVLEAIFSPDAARVAMVDERGRLRIADTTDGSPVTPLGDIARDRVVVDLRWDLTGDALAATFADGGVTLLPVPRGSSMPAFRMLPAMPIPEAGIDMMARRRSLHFLAGGGLLEVVDGGLLRGGPGGDASTWTLDLGSHDPLRVLTSADGHRVAIMGADGTLAILDGASGAVVWRHPMAYREAPPAAAFSPDGGTLYVGTRDGLIDAWSSTSGEVRRLAEVPMSIRVLAVSPTGRRIAHADARTIHVRDVASGAVRSVLANDGNDLLALEFEEDDDCLRAMHANGELRRWDLAAMESIRVIDDPTAEVVDGLRWSPSGDWLAVTRRDGRLELRRGADGVLARRVDLEDGRLWEPRFSGDGTRLAGMVVADRRRRIDVWSLPRLERIASIEFDGRHRGLAWIPETRTIVAARGDGAVVAIDVDAPAAPASVTVLHEPGHGPFGDVRVDEILAVDPVGGMLVAGTIDGPLLLGRLTATSGEPAGTPRWRLEAGPRLVGHAAAARRATFSPDGRHLATGDGVGMVQLWETASGQPLLRLPRTRGDLISGLSWLDAGRSLAVAGFDGAITIHDAGDGRLIHELEGSGRRLAFDPRSQRFASLDATDGSWLRFYGVGSDDDASERARDHPRRTASVSPLR